MGLKLRNRSVAIVIRNGKILMERLCYKDEFMCNLLRAMYDELPAPKIN